MRDGIGPGQLEPSYDVSGVDRSEAMLDVARRKLPGARLVHDDMTTVDLGETFDVVLCVYDSINHCCASRSGRRSSTARSRT